MSILGALFRNRKAAAQEWDPRPDEVHEMPARPYRALYADLPFYSDPECTREVKDSRLVVLRCEDPRQQDHPVECMPTRKKYPAGVLLRWEINHKRQWDNAWYVNPETGQKEKAWSRAVEFLGPLVVLDGKPAKDVFMTTRD